LAIWFLAASFPELVVGGVAVLFKVRGRHHADGFSNLALDERQWIMLDKALNPHLYTWEEKAEEKVRRKAIGATWQKAKATMFTRKLLLTDRSPLSSPLVSRVLLHVLHTSA